MKVYWNNSISFMLNSGSSRLERVLKSSGGRAKLSSVTSAVIDDGHGYRPIKSAVNSAVSAP